METLNYNRAYCAQYPDIVPDEMTPKAQNHLVVTVVLYLSISLVGLLKFPAGYIYKLWHDKLCKSCPHLQTKIEPSMHEIALQESDNLISDKRLNINIKIKELTHSSSKDLLEPDKVMGIYKGQAPYTAKEKVRASVAETVEGGVGADRDNDRNVEDNDPAAFKCKGDPEFKGFSRNPTCAL
ncbi:hypothetical protein NMY22_g2200 [Coprinellus aureogranulatus]|nr:hypothetical protein NMY22_g2200 [Coprinellus aureogranulatus]